MKTLMILLTMFSLNSYGAVLEGRETGNGGDAHQAEPAGEPLILNTIIDAKRELRVYFNRRSHSFNPTTAPDLDIKLFGGQPNIFELLKKTHIHVKNTGRGPCIDSDGTAHDGVSPDREWKGNTICLSIDSLSTKLTTENVRPQIIGLIAHEISHLLGTNESEANALQADIKKAFIQVSRTQTVSLLWEYQIKVDGDGASIASYLRKNADTLSRERICNFVSAISTDYGRTEDLLKFFPFSLFSKDEQANLHEKLKSHIPNPSLYCNEAYDIDIERLKFDAQEIVRLSEEISEHVNDLRTRTFPRHRPR